MNGCDFAPRKLDFQKEALSWIWPMGNVLYSKAGQTHFPGCFSCSQCKQELRHPLPPQYALELLTVYAWEKGSSETDFVMAEGFQAVLELVVNYRKLCIYWTKYYDINHSVIGPYLRRQLLKPRYSIPTGPSPPQRWTPHPTPPHPQMWLWCLGNEEGEGSIHTGHLLPDPERPPPCGLLYRGVS